MDNIQEVKSKVVEPCKLFLGKYGILLVFDDKSITFYIAPETEQTSIGNPLVEPLMRYLTFSTYLNYNIVSSPKCPNIALAEIQETSIVQFKLNQILDAHENGSTTKTSPYVLEIKTKYGTSMN